MREFWLLVGLQFWRNCADISCQKGDDNYCFARGRRQWLQPVRCTF